MTESTGGPMTADGTYRPSTRVTTAAHLATLPVGSVVLDAHGDAGLIDYSEVVRYAETAPLGFDYVVKHYGPLTVLFRPDAPQPAATGNSAFPVDREALADLQRIADRLAGSRYSALSGIAAEMNDVLLRLAALAARGDAATLTTAVRCGWCERPASGTAEHSDGLRHPACPEHGLPGTYLGDAATPTVTAEQVRAAESAVLDVLVDDHEHPGADVILSAALGALGIEAGEPT